MADELFLSDFLEHVDRVQTEIHLVVLGGSSGEGRADQNSDLDLFAFCADDAVKSYVDGLCTWVHHKLGEGALRQGPYLRDEYGIGHRFLVNGSIRVELFFISPTLWIPAPAHGKGQVIYSRSSPEATSWRIRLADCSRESFALKEYPQKFVVEQLLIWVQKIDKYLQRGQDCMAAWYGLRTHQAVLAMELASANGELFEPDYAFKKLTRVTHPQQLQVELELMGGMVMDPQGQFDSLLRRTRAALVSVDLQTEFDACLNKIGRRQ